MTRSIDTLPITITREQEANPYVVSGLAQKAFQLAGYDMSPDDHVSKALELGLLQVKDSSELKECEY